MNRTYDPKKELRFVQCYKAKKTPLLKVGKKEMKNCGIANKISSSKEYVLVLVEGSSGVVHVADKKIQI